MINYGVRMAMTSLEAMVAMTEYLAVREKIA